MQARFLGLAHYCQNGHIQTDYKKSRFDLYSEVIKFFCRRRQLSTQLTNDLDRSMRIVYFSQLLQSLLGAPPPDPHFNYTDDYIVQARGTIVEIFQLGPTYKGIVSSALANREWKASFQDSYSLPDDIQRPHEANEAYMAKIIYMPDWKTSSICGNPPPIIGNLVTFQQDLTGSQILPSRIMMRMSTIVLATTISPLIPSFLKNFLY